jgi:hypothetical protein
MSLSGYIRDRTLPRRELDPAYFADGRIRFTGLGRVDFGADCLFLETALQERGFGERARGLAATSGDWVGLVWSWLMGVEVISDECLRCDGGDA